MQHDGPYIVHNAGMVMHNDGRVLMAFNHMGTTRPNGYEQNWYVASVDSSQDSLQYFKRTSGNYYGRSSSLV